MTHDHTRRVDQTPSYSLMPPCDHPSGSLTHSWPGDHERLVLHTA